MELPELPAGRCPVEDSSSTDNNMPIEEDPPIPQGDLTNKIETVQDHPIHDQEKKLNAKENVILEETQVTQTSPPLQQGTNHQNVPLDAHRHRSTSLPSVRKKDRRFIELDLFDDTEHTSRAGATPSATMPYKVAPALMDTAMTIWETYGDIGFNCSLQSIQFRSAIFALICKVVLEMNKVGYNTLDRKTVKKWQDEVVDAEKSGWEVGWLKERVEEVACNIDAAEILLEVKKKREVERAKLKEYDEEIQRYLGLARIFSRKAFELKADKAQNAKALEGKVRVPKILAKAVETVSLWGTKAVGDGLLDATSSSQPQDGAS
ncbi:uncharacterized protein LOC122064238 [Macadamia integrifolia]|uniref:uncharacterized protein LOC122064238 n=1 Tax=Macadamia integrifolia TaxID=60698 RepID=UPI001C4F3EC7|nr:uncharacterized protein LOC122064238 [Macadamia integrifolia]